MQRAGRLPGPEAHAADLDVGVVGGQQRDRITVGRHHVALPVGADGAHLDPLHRRVDVAGHPARGGFLAEHVPRLDRTAQLDLDAVEHGGADTREPELGERVEPTGVEVDAVSAQVCGNIGDIVNHEVGQQVSAMQIRSVADQRGAQRLVPEPGHQRTHQKRLHHRHLEMRWHLEATQFQQAEPAAWGVGAVQLVDAELGAVGVAGDVGKQMPQCAIGHPRLRGSGTAGQAGDLGERDLEFVERIGPPLVDPRRLRRGADEAACEQIGQRRMTLPVGQHRDQQIGPSQQG